MRPHPVPALPGVLTADEVRATVASIACAQEPSGAVPWFPGGHVDPWDHVECAMALVAGGLVRAGERAYDWLFRTQRADGSWPIRTASGTVTDPGTDTNMCAYVAVGVRHHWLVRRDARFLRRAWRVVRRALDLVTSLQLPFGGIAWARDDGGRVADTALLAGSASIHHALCCGLALADVLDDPQPEWELAVSRLGHALRAHPALFEPKQRFSMDWYYPVLGGALRGPAAEARIRRRWPDFVVPGLGVRCVDDRPWVTGAESCELALTLDAVGRPDIAADVVSAVQHLRAPDGSYWTGYVYPDDARWPEERSTWTAAAVVLAVDALSRTTAGSGVFRDHAAPPAGLARLGPECGCEPTEDATASADGVAGISLDPR
jgi:hypothetical protein